MKYKRIEKNISFLILLTIVALSISYYKRYTLPSRKEIIPEIKHAPLQTKSHERAYTMRYKDEQYQIEPLFEYQISGVIVSQNNIHSLFDWYHDDASVDIKDLCLIWGRNAFEGNFKASEFRSEAWTCFFEPRDQDSFKRMHFDQISNNHLLSDYYSVRKKIAYLHVGDQVTIKGYLVNYWPKGYSEQIRKTSIERNDIGSGACEIIKVDSIEVLKSHNVIWNNIFVLSARLLTLLVGMRLVSFLFFPYSR